MSDKLPPELEWLTRAHVELAKATTVGQFKAIYDHAQEAQMYLKHHDLPLPLVTIAAEICLLAARGGGQAILSLHLQRGRPANDKKRLPAVTISRNFGISKILSHRRQRIARIPDAAFQRYLDDCHQAGRPPSRDGLLESEKSLRACDGSPAPQPPGRRKRPRKPAAESSDTESRNLREENDLGGSHRAVLTRDDALRHQQALGKLLADLASGRPLTSLDKGLLSYTIRICKELLAYLEKSPPDDEPPARDATTERALMQRKRRRKS